MDEEESINVPGGVARMTLLDVLAVERSGAGIEVLREIDKQ